MSNDDLIEHDDIGLIRALPGLLARPVLSLDQQYWLDRREQIIEALASEGLQICSDKDRVWLRRVGKGEPE